MVGILEGLLAALAGAAFEFLRGVLADRRAAQAQRDVGRLESERDQARAGERVNAAIADQAWRRLDDDDVTGRLDKGDA